MTSNKKNTYVPGIEVRLESKALLHEGTNAGHVAIEVPVVERT